MNTYSTQTIPQPLLDEIIFALKTVNDYGSVEIYVQNKVVTQITVRNIRKTSMSIHGANERTVRFGAKISIQPKETNRL